MRIAHIIDSLDIGGAEQMVANLAIYQSRKKSSVTVICLRELGEHPVDIDALHEAGVEILTLQKPAGFHIFTLLSLTRILKSRRIDVVHTHNHLVHHYGAIAGRLSGCRAILNTMHGTSTLQGDKFARVIYRFSCILSHRVVSVCKEVNEYMRKKLFLSRRTCCIVENGINLSTFLDVSRHRSDGTVVFGNIGRFDFVKDHRNLLTAFSMLTIDKEERPSMQLRLLGDGTLRQEMEELSRALSISGKVFFEGFRLDTERFFREIDIYVISSRSEGLPLTLLEAMGSGIPVVATAVGDIPAVLGKAKAGWICPPSDPVGLARAMAAAFRAKDRPIIGARCRETAKKFYSVSRMASEYENIYKGLLVC